MSTGRPLKNPIIDGFKVCNRCGERKPVSGYYQSSTTKTGVLNRCKTCSCRGGLEWSRENPDKHRANCQRWRQENLDRERENARKWIERNYERHRENARNKVARRNARKLATQTEPIKSSIVFERDLGLCGICGEGVDPDDYHIDHVIPLSRGGTHTYDNVQLAHPSCNYHKSNKIVERG